MFRQKKNSTTDNKKSFGSRFKEKIKAILKAIADFFRRIKNAIVNLFNKYTFDSKVASENSGQRSAFFLKSCKNSSELGKYLDNESAVLHHSIGNIMFQLTFNGGKNYLISIGDSIEKVSQSLTEVRKAIIDSNKDTLIHVIEQEYFDVQKRNADFIKDFSNVLKKTVKLEELNEIIGKEIKVGRDLDFINNNTDTAYKKLVYGTTTISNIVYNIVIRLQALRGKNVNQIYDFSIGEEKNNICSFQKVDIGKLENYKKSQKYVIDKYKLYMEGLDHLIKCYQSVIEDGPQDDVYREHVRFLNSQKNLTFSLLLFIKEYFGIITEVCRRIGGNKLVHDDISEKANE